VHTFGTHVDVRVLVPQFVFVKLSHNSHYVHVHTPTGEVHAFENKLAADVSRPTHTTPTKNTGGTAGENISSGTVDAIVVTGKV
jgi:hypothetical protein